MKKRLLSILCSAVLSLSIFAAPLTAMAEEQVSTEENEIEPRAMINYSRTLTDSIGNKYAVTGVSERVGKQAGVSTSFTIRTYGDGHLTANSYPKTMTVSGRVGMIAGANNTLPQKTYSRSGDASARVSSSDTYIYNVSLVTGSHSFSCNGVSCSGSSSNN